MKTVRLRDDFDFDIVFIFSFLDGVVPRTTFNVLT